MANKGCMLVGGGIVILLLIVVIAPYIDLDLPNSMNLRAEAYGAYRGQRISPPLAFVGVGGEMDELWCDSSWSATGTGVEWESLEISGSFWIDLYNWDMILEYTNIEPYPLTIQDVGIGAKTGDAQFRISLENLLIGQPYTGWDVSNQQYYWTIRISWSITGTIDQLYEDLPAFTDTIDDETTMTIRWQEGSFALAGGLL